MSSMATGGGFSTGSSSCSRSGTSRLKSKRTKCDPSMSPTNDDDGIHDKRERTAVVGEHWSDLEQVYFTSRGLPDGASHDVIDSLSNFTNKTIDGGMTATAGGGGTGGHSNAGQSKSRSPMSLTMTGSLGIGGLTEFQRKLASLTSFKGIRAVASTQCSDTKRSNNIFSAIGLNRNDELLALAGVSKKIILFNYASVGSLGKLDAAAEIAWDAKFRYNFIFLFVFLIKLFFVLICVLDIFVYIQLLNYIYIVLTYTFLLRLKLYVSSIVSCRGTISLNNNLEPGIMKVG